MKILCVAEKPSIAKEVSKILSGGRFQVRNSQNKYIKNYDFKFSFPNQANCDVTMTSVAGHLINIDFPPSFQWGKCVPGKLFDAAVIEKVLKQDIFDNISKEARNSNKLMIWTDCDREGEYIGYEIFKAANKGNRQIEVGDIWRSKFSHLERNHVLRAANNPIKLDLKAVDAVSCRMEIDLRVGASFTRLLTEGLKSKSIIDKGDVASYGTCQFPTLGFVVDRYKRVKNFTPEQFWYIQVDLEKDDVKCNFNWTRGHFFDRLHVMNLYQECLKHKEGKIIKLEQRRTTNWRPLPLTTVELQKDCSSIFKMSAKDALGAAEKLYNRGFLSYPRTETDKFPASFDFKTIFGRQKSDPRWGNHATELFDNGYENPRAGKHDDNAHPPIHPVNYVNINELAADEKKVYEYVVRRFLACCCKDAVGQQTTATLKWGIELFTANGLMVTERNYLDVYPYKKWESSKQLPKFQQGDMVSIKNGVMKDGKTSPPNHMTEAELISLMDINGIGTDATIAEHIEKIVSRSYVVKQKKGKVEYIIPTPLGMGLIESFDKMHFDNISLSKPFLRKKLELSLDQISKGETTKETVLEDMKMLYRQAYSISNQNMVNLVDHCKTVIQANS
ncbi:DNA topoisomerase [Scheffersomyces coipomensis]|uniref:DNA topoisomerase n=1 Tax=Scheffersomyces coipomensis TaxID=1788519 RepID=UPI00315DCE2B